MARTRSPKRELLLAILTTLIAVAYGVELLGTTLRVIHIVTIVPLSIAAGISWARAAARLRASREPERPAA
jgi:hypothetical protein